MYTKETAEQLRERGYAEVRDSDVRRVRAYGIPVLTSGVFTPRHGAWSPRWALQAVKDWPFGAQQSEDPDHYILKMVLRRALRLRPIEGQELVEAAAAIARLSGPEAVKEFLGVH